MRHDLGQHHGHGLQRLDFFLVILARDPVLHREHAIDLAAAHDGHAEKLERIFAGFRAIGKSDARRVAQIHRLGRLGDQADKTLALLHARAMDRVAIEAFGGEQLEAPPARRR
jgi:truncated hemoglobin YjbI